MSNDTTDFRLLLCEPETGKRTEINVPFRKKLPKTSLVSIEDIRCVCPDATHMITRCMETDHRKMARKIIDDIHPHEKFAIQRFEENLTRRGAKKPFFRFTAVSIGGTDKAGAVSLSGICALTVIADKEEMKEASTEIEDLFEGVWNNEVVVRPKEKTDTYIKFVKVLQAIYQSLVSKFPGETLGCITSKDASELLRKSLNECTQLLRAREDFNAIEYKKGLKFNIKFHSLSLENKD